METELFSHEGTRRDANENRRGSALLLVLWLAAALSAIAFSVANTVRSETGRVSASADGLKAQYLATGAIERALVYIQWSWYYRNPDGTARYYTGAPRMEFDFSSGHATVDVIPETSKMNVNTSTPEDIYRVLTLLGADPGRAREIVLAILDWRTPVAAGDLTSFDQQYLGRNPSFHSRHASFEEIEELLLMKGMTPELFYGAYERGPQGRLVPHHGVRDCLSVYGSTTQFDVNTADPAVLAAAGLTPEAVSAVVQRRSVEPFLKPEELSAFGQDMPGFNRLRVGGNTMFTVRATARPRLPDGKLSDARRTVAVLVKFLDPSKFTEPYHVLRWYENVWVQ